MGSARAAARKRSSGRRYIIVGANDIGMAVVRRISQAGATSRLISLPSKGLHLNSDIAIIATWKRLRYQNSRTT